MGTAGMEGSFKLIAGILLPRPFTNEADYMPKKLEIPRSGPLPAPMALENIIGLPRLVCLLFWIVGARVASVLVTNLWL